MTVTLGLATYPTDSEGGLELVDLADRAMYLGKQQGGNRVSPSPGLRPSQPQATRDEPAPPRPFRLLVVDDMEAMRLAPEDCLSLQGTRSCR